MSEVYFCGKCRTQQLPARGEKCIMCGRITVSWYTDRESETMLFGSGTTSMGEPSSAAHVGMPIQGQGR